MRSNVVTVSMSRKYLARLQNGVVVVHTASEGKYNSISKVNVLVGKLLRLSKGAKRMH